MMSNELNIHPENGKIELIRPGRRNGLLILKEDYELLCQFVFDMIESKGEITLTDLLETASDELATRFSGQAQWIVLNVKHDLEARGFLRIRYHDKCVQSISLKENQRRSIGFFLGKLKFEVP